MLLINSQFIFTDSSNTTDEYYITELDAGFKSLPCFEKFPFCIYKFK